MTNALEIHSCVCCHSTSRIKKKGLWKDYYKRLQNWKESREWTVYDEKVKFSVFNNPWLLNGRKGLRSIMYPCGSLTANRLAIFKEPPPTPTLQGKKLQTGLRYIRLNKLFYKLVIKVKYASPLQLIGYLTKRGYILLLILGRFKLNFRYFIHLLRF